MTYMLDAKVAHASNLNLPIINRILDRLPTFEPFGLSAVRAVEEEEINITQSTLLDRLFDCLPRRLVGSIRGQLRGEVDVFPFQAQRIRVAGQEIEDGFPDFVLVVIHLSGVDP